MAGTQAEAALSRAQQSMEQGNLEGVCILCPPTRVLCRARF